MDRFEVAEVATLLAQAVADVCADTGPIGPRSSTGSLRLDSLEFAEVVLVFESYLGTSLDGGALAALSNLWSRDATILVIAEAVIDMV